MFSVSVLIPFLSVDKYLFHCLEGVLCQNSVELQLVLVHDSGLSSDSLNHLNDFLSKRNINYVLVKAEKRGMAPALNTGLSACIYEYVARVDSDDIMLPNRLQSQVQYLTNNQKVVVVGGQLEFISEDGSPASPRYSNYPTGVAVVREAFERGCYVAHPAVTFRKTSVLKLGGYREEFKFAEDYDLWLRILDIGEIDNLPIPVTQYRQHPGQASNNFELIELYSLAANVSREWRRLGITDIPSVSSLINWPVSPVNLSGRQELINLKAKMRKISRLEFIISSLRIAVIFPQETVSELRFFLKRRIRRFLRI
jgi:glycosyltransferase involved in cell wall biosynthesis